MPPTTIGGEWIARGVETGQQSAKNFRRKFFSYSFFVIRSWGNDEMQLGLTDARIYGGADPYI